MATQADYNVALDNVKKAEARAQKAEEALQREREETLVIERAAYDMHDTITRLLACIQEYAEAHGDTAGNGGLAKVAQRLEAENPWLELHPDLATFGLAIKADVEGAMEFNGQVCTVCRAPLSVDEEDSICATCLRTDAEEREADPATTERIHDEADRDAGIDAKDGRI